MARDAHTPHWCDLHGIVSNFDVAFSAGQRSKYSCGGGKFRRALMREFTRDTGIQRSMNMYQQEPAQMQARTGIDQKLMEYAGGAIKLIAD